MVYAKCTN